MMGILNIRSLLLVAIVICNCIPWTSSRHHYTHNVNGHRSRHRRQGAGLFLPGSYVLPGGEGAGAWGEWGELSPCSRTCGGGVASQKRICLEISPDGQPQCTGGDTKYISCATQDCPEGSMDFRSEQCAEYNDKLFRNNKYYNWVPYTKAMNPCQLICMPHGERFYIRQKDKVIDGTRCNDESFDVCVDGVCQPVGCDRMLGSNAREDKCRQCRGNGTDCRTIAGTLDTQELRQGYSDILVIPEGATNIVIGEIKNSDNYLALRAKEDNRYYLNGDYHIDFPRSLMIAGALWHYERSPQGLAAADKLRCLGPTNETLYLTILLQGKNVGIEYEYSVPLALAPPPHQQYIWVQGEFSECSATCAGGYQTREVTCRSRNDLELVDDNLCDSTFKPDVTQTCNKQACSPEWVEEPWGPCSKPCGDGGTRSRQVHCQKIITDGETFSYPTMVADKECFDILGPKPELYQQCNQNETCPTWFTGPWKPCDKLRGEGKQTRQVVCHQKIKGRVQVYDDGECTDDKPPSEQPCLLHPEDGVDWVVSDWSGCDTCMSTLRTRTALCVTKGHQVVDSNLCSYHPNLVLQEPCDKNKLPSCKVQWYATQWSPCSVDCGNGIQTRRVFCGMFDDESVSAVDDDDCDILFKYNDTKECEAPKEKCPEKWFAGPWSKCSKKCGGGVQKRHTICMRGGKEVLNCKKDKFIGFEQSCNIGPCDKDEMIPIDVKSTTIMDEEDDDECIDEEEEGDYPEVGAEILDTKSTTLEDSMFSDTPFVTGTEGSGMSSSYSDTESEFSSLMAETGSGATSLSVSPEYETEPSGATTEQTGTTLDITSTTDVSTELTETTSDTTDSSVSTITPDITTSSDSNTEETETSSNIMETSGSSTEQTETSSDITDSSDVSTEHTERTSEITKSSDSTIEETTVSTTSDITASSGTSTEQTEATSDITDSSGASTENTEITPEITTITEEIEISSTITELGTATTELSTATTELSTATTELTGTIPDITASSGASTEQTETSTDITASSGTSTEPTEATSDITDSSSISTENMEITTDITTTIEETEISSTNTEPSGTSTEQTDTTSDTTDSSGVSTEHTEITITSDSTTEETTISSNIEPSVETTEQTETTSDIAASSGTSTEQTEATSDITDSSSMATEKTETSSDITEASGSTAEPSEIISETSDSSGMTEPTKTTVEVTEPSSSMETILVITESTLISSTEAPEPGSTVESSTTTESVSVGSSTTDENVNRGTTTWDWSSTVKVNPPKHCKRRKRAKCIKSKFGCCPDKRTPAEGPFEEGCSNATTCKDSEFGCCPDGVSPAKGHPNKGCPISACNETLFGCCKSDNVTAAEGNDQEGCPLPPPACASSKFGCCKDYKTESKGLRGEGCPETETTTIMSTDKTESTTEPVRDCVKSAYGCCYDNETDASGPNGTGCPCSISQFGCCLDGITTALGANMEGCVDSCNTSTYGCCPDGETPAHGPELEGCCLLSQFGCCPDNYKPAEGINLEGCGCEYAHFGCCPDNVTVARGPDKEGCGCQYSQFGCCLDRHTEATGPELEGCGCHTYQFGCCPDGETKATGPNQEGCRCEQSKYGCCGDGVTAAKGPNRIGCDCSNSKYGCCPDGVTEAKGKKFLNCTDVLENRQAACALAKDGGTCRQVSPKYTAYWYYDQSYGGCSRFWYSGCEGNSNRFSSQQECEDVCVHPEPKDACNLPMVKGACNGYNVHWYYDSAREQCSQFVYGGCLGNDNNFDSRELCQKQCEPDKAEDQCNLPIEQGPCAGNYLRWGYDSETQRCSEFLWGGCAGNKNRFSTEAACMVRCNPPGTPQDKCQLIQDVGNCTEKIPVWSFNQTENVCVPFYYTGCGGNANRFNSEQDCTYSCPSDYVQEVCTLPALAGDCGNYTLRWFYDTARETCRQFYYGGCGGNENNFHSMNECENRCLERQITTTLTPVPQNRYTTEYCYKERDPGPCKNNETRWAYDERRGICAEFTYGGCGGNENNFHSIEDCQYYCRATTDICQLPMVTGPCGESLMRWFYDDATDSCSRFAYGGCEGNFNRFNTLDECENRCRRGGGRPAPATAIPYTTTTPASDALSGKCQIGALEECREPGRVWYYDNRQRGCVSYDNPKYGTYCRYTGVFKSEEACERSCGVFRDLEVCRYPLDAGTCTSAVPKFYYNEESHRCEEFVYGGCQGGPNRFSSIEECEQMCMPDSQPPVIDPCTLEVEPGNCLANIMSWYYDQERGDCSQFMYGGCNGNENRFDTREACLNRCTTSALTTTVAPITSAQQLVDAECQTPVSLDPCGENIAIYYYDSKTQKCELGDFGSCRYANSYRTEEECERKCGTFKEIDVCGYPLDPGPCRDSISKLYWDAPSGRCLPFTYGGCLGGPNRFSKLEECEEVCGDTGPESVCLLPVETGMACGASMRRWYYSAADAECLPFVYSGCSGNENSFRSYEECALRCKISTNEKPAAPRVNNDTKPEVTGNVGDKATLRCLFHGNPPPIITWRKGEITIDGDASHYRLLSDGALEIASLYRNDSGVYICIAENNLGRATQVIRLEVNGDDITSNEVIPQCNEYITKCKTLRCAYGRERYTDTEGCERCRCLDHPCSGKECPAGERCITVPYDDTLTKQTRYYADCRVANKTGYCPIADGKTSTENQCRRECYDDADCEGDGKCCERGCSHLCLEPSAPIIPPLPSIYAPDITGNEVVPQCDEYIAECAALRCEYAVQRVQTSGGCVQCSCISVEVNCSRLTSECESLMCAYGTERYTGEDGCERCRCLAQPCSGKECPAGERCVTVPYDDPLTKYRRYYADCRVANKTGYCPIEDGKTSTENQCRRECYDDADCVGVGKCCERGCSQLCLEPSAPTIPPLPSTYAPGMPQAPSADVATATNIAVNEGGKATLRCLFHGNPPPIITWRKGEITINGNADRYMLLSDGTLEIASLYRNDSGVYICIAENHLGRATQEIRLDVNDPVDGPAGIAGVPNRVMFSELDTPLNIRCLAYGNPKPSIVWYRGRNGPMVPYSSSLYEARENILQIRRINSETLGEYLCQAYNGIGKPAEQMFTVQAYRPEGPDDFPHMAPQTNEVHVTPRQVLTEATTTVKVVYTVPVNTSISATSTRLRAGSEINLKCEIDGFPVPDVYWTKDGARISSNDRMQVTEARVTLAHAATSDSGVYGCHASNAFSSHNSIVQINVEGYIPPSCKDNPYFADCSLIVRSKFCRHKYYSGFCCQSCAEAGLLDPMQIDMQADQGWYKRK